MNKKKLNVFRVSCPVCRTDLWIDTVSQEVVKSEKSKKKKGTLDDLLEKEKKKKALEKFAEVLTKIDPDE